MPNSRAFHINSKWRKFFAYLSFDLIAGNKRFTGNYSSNMTIYTEVTAHSHSAPYQLRI